MTDDRFFAATLEVDGLPTTWQSRVRQVVVDENVNLPDAASVTIEDKDREFLREKAWTVGKPLRIVPKVVGQNDSTPLFSGEITAVELDFDRTGTFVILRALSAAHRLFRGKRVRAFRQMTTEGIVKEVATKAKIPMGRFTADRVTYKQISQAGVSDWEFLQELAARHGAVVSVDETGTLHFVTPRPASTAPATSTPASASPMVLQFGENLLSLRAVVSTGEQVDQVEVRGWNVDTAKAVVAKAPAADNPAVLPDRKPARPFTGVDGLVTGPFGSQAEAAAVAGAVAGSISAAQGEIEAVVVGEPKLRAGVPVALTEVGSGFAGRYTATAVHHVLDPDLGYRTTVLVGASADRSLAGLTGATAVRAPTFPGVVTGIVTDIREEGGERGWVRLKFPWLDDTYQSDWARTVQFGGRRGGGVFSPEVNDEVLVGFEHGSLDRPYVIGGLYNGVDKPSQHKGPLVGRDGKVSRRSLVSRDGHRLELRDGLAGDLGVRLRTGDERLEVEMDPVLNRLRLTVRGPGGRGVLTDITLDSTGITLDAGTGNVTITGATVDIKATAQASVDGGLLAKLEGRLVHINPPKI